MPNPITSKYNGSQDVVRPQDIRWQTVKTEEEEYLDKLQSKLSRVMDGFPPTPPKETDDRLDSDDLPDIRVTQPVTQDHDEGLHLMYDFPRSVVDDTPSSQPFSSSSQPTKIDVTPDGDISPSRHRTIRFRSRVRIASGAHSVSSSCGSSISVPLQGPHGPDVSMSTAPPSGKLPTAAAANAWLNSRSSSRNPSSSRDRDERRKNCTSPRSSHIDERTPLASASHPGARRSYTEQTEEEVEEDADAELDRLRAAARKSEEQVMFGKWPWRLLNRHWWWWKVEPIVCCCLPLDDDSDLE